MTPSLLQKVFLDGTTMMMFSKPKPLHTVDPPRENT